MTLIFQLLFLLGLVTLAYGVIVLIFFKKKLKIADPLKEIEEVDSIRKNFELKYEDYKKKDAANDLINKKKVAANNLINFVSFQYKHFFNNVFADLERKQITPSVDSLKEYLDEQEKKDKMLEQEKKEKMLEQEKKEKMLHEQKIKKFNETTKKDFQDEIARNISNIRRIDAQKLVNVFETNYELYTECHKTDYKGKYNGYALERIPSIKNAQIRDLRIFLQNKFREC